MVSRFALSASLLTILLTAELQAGFFCDDGGCKPSGCGCEVKWVCCPKWEKEKIEKHCYNVECEHICVPRVKLPWQNCCEPRCARVICVRKLKKHTYECGEKCVLEWEAKPVCTRCCKPGYGYNCGPAASCGPSACMAPQDYHAPAELQPVPAGQIPAPPAQ